MQYIWGKVEESQGLIIIQGQPGSWGPLFEKYDS